MTAEQSKVLIDKYLKNRKFMMEYATSSLQNYALAEEAVQQAFEIACLKIDDFCGSSNPDGWLTKVLSFVIRNIERRRCAERRVIADVDEYRPDLVPAPEQPIPLEITYGSLAKSSHFQLIYEMEILGKTLTEIARDLGISEAACKKRVERARKYLQKRLK